MSNKQKVLIVDDAELNRSLLTDILGEEYEILEAENGFDAIKILKNRGHEISLVLLDIVMPELDGLEVLSVMQKNDWLEQIPVIVISAETNANYIDNAYDLGAVEYINRPFEPKTIQRRVTNVLTLYSKQKILENMATEQFLEKERSNKIMVEVLSHIVEFRNGKSGVHILDIRFITELLLKQLCFISDEYHYIKDKISLISNASVMHDIGKISIDEALLNKPTNLTEEEVEIMKGHSLAGANLLEKTRYYPQEELIKVARDICLWHHERYDGKGYPDGLVGDEIPIEVQVVSLADVYDTLTHKRIGKRAFTHVEAMKIILDGECGAFNPLLLECLIELSAVLKCELKLASMESISLDETKATIKNLLQKGSVSSRTLSLLEQERTKYNFFSEMSNEILFEYSMQGDILTLSEFASRQLNLPEVTVHPFEVGKISPIIREDDFNHLKEQIQTSNPEFPMIVQTCYLKIHERYRWYKILARPLWIGDNTDDMTGVIGKCIDIHEEVTQMDYLKHKINTDDLTGLNNAHFARTTISELLISADVINENYALILFDLDYFKNANDTHGHMFGNSVLSEVGNRLRECVKDPLVIARIGGDEFLAFIKYTDDLTSVIDEMFKHLNGDFEGFDISTSMGIASVRANELLYEELFHQADQALYESKKRGKKCYCFYDESMNNFPTETHI